MGLTVREVINKSDLRAFIKLPWAIYKGDPNWVPPLILDMKERLNPKKNPYFDHSQVKLYLAEREGKICGRIAATVNNNHNAYHQENIGFFGFFECEDHQETANALFDQAAKYLKECGVELMRGPANLSSNEEWGLLINAFDRPPLVMMTYNPPYYIDLMENYGFSKAMDIHAYWVYTNEMTDKAGRIAEKLKNRANITVRTVDMKHFWDEVEKIREIYNSAWSRNWGFVPFTPREFEKIAKDLKNIIDPDLVFIAESAGKPVGFSMALPDINQALIKINGRLLPFGIFKLLYYKNKIRSVRIPTMGVIPEYLKRGIDAIFYYESFLAAKRKGIIGGEFSWVLEINDMMNRAAVHLGGKVYKTYRLYDYKFS